jgi:nucleotide-binding universal stress UspA family protein
MYRNILVPLDGSHVAECSLPHVKAVARAFQIYTLFLITVLMPVGSRVLSRIPASKLDIVKQSSEANAREYLSRIATALNNEGFNAEAIVVSGKPAEQVVDFAEKNSIDLIVMSTHGRSGLSRRHYGSVTERVMRMSSVPILVVRPTA